MGLKGVAKRAEKCSHKRNPWGVWPDTQGAMAFGVLPSRPCCEQSVGGCMTVIEQLRATQGLIGRTRLAALLGAHKQTVWTWVLLGKIPHLRVGSRLRFDPAGIADWLESKQVL